MEKRCKNCLITKEIAEFSRAKNRKDGHINWCRACSNKRSREKYNPKYYRKTREKHLAYFKIWNKSLNGRYSSYKKNAKAENKSFNLSKEVFNQLTTDQICFYCGTLPGNGYTGIDRINSKLGYEVGNMVSCCTTCNFMKHELTLEDFRSHILKLAERFKNDIQLHRNPSKDY